MFRFAQHDNARLVQSPRVLNIEDLRAAAKRRLPRVVFDYIDGGAEDESTLRANCRAFETVTLRPRCAVATPVCKNAVPIKAVELDVSQAADVACFASTTVGSAGASGNSVCANTQWDIAATATDTANTGATAIVHQGIAQRVAIDTTC